MNGHIFAFITCTRVNWECGVLACDHYGCMDYPNEERGWIDRRWSKTQLFDNRNDVSPVVDVDLSDPDSLQDEITDALSWLEGGYEDNGDGSFYARDSYKPYTEAWDYSYVLHFTRKYYGANGYVEEPWHPARDGGFNI